MREHRERVEMAIDAMQRMTQLCTAHANQNDLDEGDGAQAWSIGWRPLLHAVAEAYVHPAQASPVRQHALSTLQRLILSAEMDQRLIFDEIMFPLAEKAARIRPLAVAKSEAPLHWAIVTVMCRTFLHYLTRLDLGSDKTAFWSAHTKEEALITHVWGRIIQLAHDQFATKSQEDHLVFFS